MNLESIHLDGVLRGGGARAMREAFAVIVGARDAGIHLVQEAASAGRTLRGFEVDDAVSGYIASRGMAHCIRHRTGHSIGREVHGVGGEHGQHGGARRTARHPVDVFLGGAGALPADLRGENGGQRIRPGTWRARDRRDTDRVRQALKGV